MQQWPVEDIRLAPAELPGRRFSNNEVLLFFVHTLILGPQRKMLTAHRFDWNQQSCAEEPDFESGTVFSIDFIAFHAPEWVSSDLQERPEQRRSRSVRLCDAANRPFQGSG